MKTGWYVILFLASLTLFTFVLTQPAYAQLKHCYNGAIAPDNDISKCPQPPSYFVQQKTQQYPPQQLEYYQETGFRLTGNPTICAETPQDPDFPNVAQITLHETQDAVSDWQSNLGKPFVLNYLVVPLNQMQKFDFTRCNIIISYQAQPDQKNIFSNGEPTGITHFDFLKHKANVTIFYLLVDYQGGTRFNQTLTPGGWVTYTQAETAPYFTHELASNSQLEYTIRHELGHTFGLGHFIITDHDAFDYLPSVGGCYWTDKSFCWGKIIESLPSLMITELGPEDYSENGNIHVKTKDVTEIKKYLYGNNGFNSPIFPSNESSYLLPSSFQPTSTNVTASTNATTIKIPSWIKNNAKWWSQNQMQDTDFIKGIQYLIQQGILRIPQSSVGILSSQQIPQWVKTTAGWWGNGEVSDDEFMKAIQYLISNGIITVS